MEFFYCPETDQLTVIEFNPRLASQFSDLYQRVTGLNLHAMALALAHGMDPACLSVAAPTAGAASSFVYRLFNPRQLPHQPGPAQQQHLQTDYPDALLLTFPKAAGSMARDYKWLGSHRYGIMHLGGANPADLRQRCEAASALLGWTAPYTDLHAAHPPTAEALAAPQRSHTLLPPAHPPFQETHS
jgi:hypothetical protein